MRQNYDEYDDSQYDGYDEEDGGGRKGVLIAGIAAILVVLFGGGAFIMMNSDKDTTQTASNDSSNSAIYVRADRKFELGEKIVLSPSTFADSRRMSSSDISKLKLDSKLMTDTSKYSYNSSTKAVTTKGAKLLEVGEYSVQLSLGNDVKTAEFKVVDTTAPEFTNWSDKIYITQVSKESDVNLNQYFAVTDYAKTTISVKPDRKAGTNKFDVTKAGEYNIIVTAQDESGNKTEKKCVVDVLAVDSSSKTLMLSKTTDTILKNGEEIKKNEEKKEEEKKEEEKKNENTSEVVIPTTKPSTPATPETPEAPVTPAPEKPAVQVPATPVSTIADQNVYRDEHGELYQSINTLPADGFTYFFSDGVKQGGWQKITIQENRHDYVQYYLFDNTTGRMQTGWYTNADGNKFWFGPEGDQQDGRMRTGIVVMDGKRYEFSNDGVLVNTTDASSSDKTNTSGTHLGPDAAKDPESSMPASTTGIKGTIDPTDTTVYKDDKGTPYEGFVTLNDNVYYFNKGIKQNGFIVVNASRRYFFDPSNKSAMSVGEIKTSGKWYLANTKGVIMTGLVQLKIVDDNGNAATHYYGYDTTDGHKLYGYKKVGSKYYCFDMKTGERLYGDVVKYVNKSDAKDVIYVEKGKESNYDLSKYSEKQTAHFGTSGALEGEGFSD